jgi:tRNA threonylcarbamoyladenosine biosynthesis protein TsaE
MQITTHSSQETLNLGIQLAGYLQAGDLVLLFGDLGCGKTLLTKGICKGLRVPEEEYIRSPSFTLINEYQAKFPIIHADLYRLENAAEIESIGLEDVLYTSAVTIIEWAEKLYKTVDNKEFISHGIDDRFEIRITVQEDESRLFDIQSLHACKRPLPDFTLL